MKTYVEWRCNPTILDLGTPRPLYPRGNGSQYPLNRRLGGSQSRSGRSGEEKYLALPVALRSTY
jgi:hypothetical protein